MKRVFFALCLLLLPAIASATEAADTELLPMGLKIMAALAVVLGIMLLLYALLKKSGRWIRTGKDSSIKLLEVRYLAPKKALYLIEVNGSTLLLSGTAGRLETLAQWPKAHADKEGAAPVAATFDTALEHQVALHHNQDV
jgi:flagellar protein FliO/FliZ